ncbi:cytochrome c biogenesis protein CcdA [Methyloglobulus sp.]|uniref:protein-disulfide reductase DsbD family protein n=1 Tax=Methyloglobulus sp. TaxID=2518622 RepID=UPI0032B77682
MKNLVSILMLWMLSISLTYAEIPKANISVTPLDTDQWPAQYRLTLTIPKDHHAYLDTGDENIYIPVTVDPNSKLAASGLIISKLQKPSGVHDSLVKANVLRDKGDFTLELAQTKPSSSIKATNLEVTYQLCNELTNVCFRPQTMQLNLTLPTTTMAAAVPADTQADDESLSFMDKLLALFNNNKDNMFIMFGLMFFAGILSVATPCVYPMLPITSMFIVGRANGDANKEKQHALAYFVGIVITYMALGLMAGMTGGAFNTLMQSAYVNLGFALFFAFFALALLGFYELSFMQNEVHSLDQHSSKVKGVSGTLLMGSVAGLVISPCVGPIVFALLLQVADNIAEKSAALALANQSMGFLDKLTISSQGSVMMAGFGLGVGLPFFLFSVVKFKKLPKAGYWMNKVKYAFGFMILYFAYTYLQKGMGVLGVDSSTTVTLAIGLLAIWIAVVHCHVLTLMPHDAQPNQKMQHYVGVLSMIVGGWLMVASLGQMPFMNMAHAESFAQNGTAQGASSNVPVAMTVQKEAGISWYRSFEAAKKVAKETGKPIFIDFYASWCANCTEFKKESASNEQLNQALREKAIAVKLVDKEPEFEKFRASQEHRQLKIGLPYFAIITPDGKLSWSGTDYKATQKMIAELDRLS